MRSLHRFIGYLLMAIYQLWNFCYKEDACVNALDGSGSSQSIDWKISPSEFDLNDSVIGKGSSGEIRRAIWRRPPVGVRTIWPSLFTDKMVLKYFWHETEVLTRVRHPNLVQFLGAVRQQPSRMLITEYFAGETCMSCWQRKKSCLPLCCEILSGYSKRDVLPAHRPKCLHPWRSESMKPLFLMKPLSSQFGTLGCTSWLMWIMCMLCASWQGRWGATGTWCLRFFWMRSTIRVWMCSDFTWICMSCLRVLLLSKSRQPMMPHSLQQRKIAGWIWDPRPILQVCGNWFRGAGQQALRKGHCLTTLYKSCKWWKRVFCRNGWIHL